MSGNGERPERDDIVDVLLGLVAGTAPAGDEFTVDDVGGDDAPDVFSVDEQSTLEKRLRRVIGRQRFLQSPSVEIIYERDDDAVLARFTENTTVVFRDIGPALAVGFDEDSPSASVTVLCLTGVHAELPDEFLRQVQILTGERILRRALELVAQGTAEERVPLTTEEAMALRGSWSEVHAQLLLDHPVRPDIVVERTRPHLDDAARAPAADAAIYQPVPRQPDNGSALSRLPDQVWHGNVPTVTVATVGIPPDLSMVLASARGIRLVASAASVDELLAGPGRHADVVLIDLDAHGRGNPSEIFAPLARQGIPVAACGAMVSPSEFRRLVQVGMLAYVPRPHGPNELVTALRSAAEGSGWMSPSAAFPLLADAEQRRRPDLSASEIQALSLYASGLPTRLVAGRMMISDKTVRGLLEGARGKYLEVGRDAVSDHDLRQRAVEDGLVSEAGHQNGSIY